MLGDGGVVGRGAEEELSAGYLASPAQGLECGAGEGWLEK